MKTIKLDLALLTTNYVVLLNHGWSSVLCGEFVKDCLGETPPVITVWITPSETGNIITAKPSFIRAYTYGYKELGWRWNDGRELQEIYEGLGKMLKPGRYNVYISEGWV